MEFTCDGQDQSPDLEWTGIPQETKSIVITCDDPDAPGGTFTHWLLFDVPATETGVPKSIAQEPTLPDGSKQGRNNFGRVGYSGPCPPHGSKHRYFFRIYALNAMSGLSSEASRTEIERVLKSHMIGEGSLEGAYRRR